MPKLSHSEIVHRQEGKINEPRLAFHVLLNNIRSLYNVGSIFRTADGAGVEKIWICGITGFPPNSQISKTALGAEEAVAWQRDQNAQSIIRQLRSKGFQIVLLEQAKESKPLVSYVPRPPVCLVVGNEIAGVDDELLTLCDDVVEIEMSGIKNSLNVAVAFGIAAYHIRNSLILSSP